MPSSGGPGREDGWHLAGVPRRGRVGRAGCVRGNRRGLVLPCARAGGGAGSARVGADTLTGAASWLNWLLPEPFWLSLVTCGLAVLIWILWEVTR